VAEVESALLCANHPEQSAVARCDQCGKPFCGDCRVEDVAADEVYCSDSCHIGRANAKFGAKLTSERVFLEDSVHPIRSGWRLWARSLGPICMNSAMLATLIGLAAWALGPAAPSGASNESDYSLSAAAVLLTVGAIGMALMQVLMSQRYTGLVKGDRYIWTLRSFLRWLATSALTLVISYAGLLVLIIPGIYVGLRLFWADEFALIHGVNPIRALKESWRLTSDSAGAIFAFQFLVGLALYVVFLAGLAVVTAGRTLIEALAGAPLPDALSLAVVAFVFFVGYAAAHAPEVVRFYGMRAEQARSSGQATKPLGIT
jgi:hypothetical protein